MIRRPTGRWRATLTAIACVVPTLLVVAAQPQFWRLEGARDFLEGELLGLSVESDGRVRLAPATEMLHDTESPQVWALARDKKGVVYAGTGNEGKVFRLADGKASVFFDAEELEVHALAVGPDGRLYAGTSPDGKVYAIDAAGKAETFYDPPDKYIWALAFDKQAQLLVATGSEARIHRVDSKGQGQVVLTSPETHITALAVDAKGDVLAGSAPGGIVYRIDPSLKVSVLHDSGFKEVKALASGADGKIYAAVIDGSAERTPARAPALPVPAPLPLGPEGFFGESVITVAPAPTPAPSARPADTTRGPVRGAVLRLDDDGDVERLWSSQDDTPFAMVRDAEGVLVGTGGKGKLFRVKDDRTWTMVTTFPAEQVTALLRGEAGVTVALSNPGKLFSLAAAAGPTGSFVSRVKDTETVSSWGRLSWEATLPAGSEVQIQTRTGNTGTPDTTWSEWSAPYKESEGAPVTSERARFIQVRATLSGKTGATAVLGSVQTAYLQRNLRPNLTTLTVHPPGEVFQKPLQATGEIEILGLEPGQGPELRPGPQASPRPGLPLSPYGRRLYQRGLQTFSWRAEDPNGDTLLYDVHYRAAQETTWRPLRTALSDAVLTWDTSTVPDGRYVLRVTASDAPSNPEALALAADRESEPFSVDNTPPAVQATLVPGRPARVRVQVKDDSSLIRKAEYATDGGRWQEVHPSDGINDALEERYEIVLAGLAPGSHILVVRATDLLGNVATARVFVSGSER